VVTAYNLLVDTTAESWNSVWHVVVWASVALSVVITIWFTVGGLRDLRDMFRTLRTAKRVDADDGTVYDEERATS
jgi:SSS family solute:Na+ symporter